MSKQIIQGSVTFTLVYSSIVILRENIQNNMKAENKVENAFEQGDFTTCFKLALCKCNIIIIIIIIIIIKTNHILREESLRHFWLVQEYDIRRILDIGHGHTGIQYLKSYFRSVKLATDYMST